MWKNPLFYIKKATKMTVKRLTKKWKNTII